MRVKDLRFTSSEAAAFLNQVMGLNLSVEDIAALEARTEGWIAGLQLAALSLQGRADVSGFLSAFSGSHREVLARQQEPVQQLYKRSRRNPVKAARRATAMTSELLAIRLLTVLLLR